jgi:phytoene dehydrogenase-like protein
VSAAFDAIVIGAGANGLVAATALAQGGKRTLLLERSNDVGGQAAAIEFAPGFRAAPVALDADWLPPSVQRGIRVSTPALANANTLTNVADGNGFLSISADVRTTVDALRARSPRDADAWPAFVTTLHSVAGFLEHLYQAPPIDVDASGIEDMRGMASLAWRFRALGRQRMTDVLRVLPMSVDELLDDSFEDAALKAAVAAGGIRGIRQGPRSGGTAFVLLHNLTGAGPGAVRRFGYWRAGAHALVSTLETAARQAGVVIRASASVAQIHVRDYAVSGVVLDTDEEIATKLVLSSADPHRTLLGLIDPVWLDPDFMHAVHNIKFRGCTTFVLYALDALPDFPGLDHATRNLAGWVSLSPDMMAIERACDATKYGRIAERPHVEFTVSSLRWPETAPNGRHVLVARAQYMPWRLRDDMPWDESVRDQVADSISRAIADVSPGFTGRVLHRVTLGPHELAERFALTEGAASQGEMMLDQILFMRPVPGWGRYVMPIRGLYLCGAGTHPGPGVPGGAGWLAARAALAGDAK